MLPFKAKHTHRGFVAQPPHNNILSMFIIIPFRACAGGVGYTLAPPLIKFLDSFNLQSKDAADKNVQKLKHIQDEFNSNLVVMKKFKERVHQYDMKTLLQVLAVYRDIVGVDAWDA